MVCLLDAFQLKVQSKTCLLTCSLFNPLQSKRQTHYIKLMLTILQVLKWFNAVLHSNLRVPRARQGMLQILKSVPPSKQLDSTAIDYLAQILRDISSSNEFKDDHKRK